jgi:hypothetical protein
MAIFKSRKVLEIQGVSIFHGRSPKLFIEGCQSRNLVFLLNFHSSFSNTAVSGHTFCLCLCNVTFYVVSTLDCIKNLYDNYLRLTPSFHFLLFILLAHYCELLHSKKYRIFSVFFFETCHLSHLFNLAQR